jgi:hypothetical protein
MHPDNNDQGDERDINQEFPFGVHSCAPASVTGLEPLLGSGSPKQEWKPLSQSSGVLDGVTAVERHQAPNQEAQAHNRDSDGH